MSRTHRATATAAAILLALTGYTALALRAAPGSATRDRAGRQGYYEVTVDHVHDGDTVIGTIRLPWRVSIGPQAIRASNYDTWESTATRQTVDVDADEIAKGKAATAYLEELLAKPKAKLYVQPDGDGKRDAYGRPLGAYWLRTDKDWQDVGDLMRAGGHTRTEPEDDAP